MEYKSYYESPLGTIILTSDGNFLTGLLFTTSRFKNLTEVTQNQIKNDLEIFVITKDWLNRYFNGDRPNPDKIPLKLIGTEFCQKVWEILQAIPYGSVITYGDIAKIIAKQRGINKMSAQAVGYAVGHNPISIIVPCHRVVGANGNLTGYGGGIDKKIGLLKIENIDINKFLLP